jgi:hypothetical protein
MKNITMPHHRRTEESSPAQTRKRSEDSWVAKGCQLDIMRTRHASGSPRGKSRCSPGMAKHSQGRNSPIGKPCHRFADEPQLEQAAETHGSRLIEDESRHVGRPPLQNSPGVYTATLSVEGRWGGGRDGGRHDSSLGFMPLRPRFACGPSCIRPRQP